MHRERASRAAVITSLRSSPHHAVASFQGEGHPGPAVLRAVGPSIRQKKLAGFKLTDIIHA